MMRIRHIERLAYSTAKEAVNGRARDYAIQYGITMKEAIARALGEDLPLMMRFSAEMSGGSTSRGGGDAGERPFLALPEIGQDLASRVKEYHFQHPELSYGEAHSLVMEHEPELKAAYWDEIVAPVGLNSAAEAQGMSSGVSLACR